MTFNQFKLRDIKMPPDYRIKTELFSTPAQYLKAGMNNWKNAKALEREQMIDALIQRQQQIVDEANRQLAKNKRGGRR